MYDDEIINIITSLFSNQALRKNQCKFICDCFEFFLWAARGSKGLYFDTCQSKLSNQIYFVVVKTQTFMKM